MRRQLIIAVTLAGGALVPGGAAHADAPVIFVDSGSVDEVVDCGGQFEATVQGSGTARFIAFFDDDGELLRFTKHVSAPADIWTNTATGKSITVRGNFVQSHVPIEGTDYFAVTIRGFRYMVNEPGSGVVVQEVGRITYADAFEEVALTQAGKHDLADPGRIGIEFCTALGATPPPADGT